MLGNSHFYYRLLRKYVIIFGNLFNDITVVRTEKDSNKEIKRWKVPIVYAPKDHFVTRLESDPDLFREFQNILPRLSFEITGIGYDASRKQNSLLRAAKGDNASRVSSQFMGVPYDINFELNLYTKTIDDGTQIAEQILPYFQPSFNLTVDLVDSIGEKRDIPIVLDNVSFTDDYEGDFSSRRILIYTFNFTAKTYLFGPIADTTDGLIRKVQVDYYTSTDKTTAKREMRYTVVPDPIDANPGDDFGFSETTEMLFDSKTYSPSQQQDI